MAQGLVLLTKTLKADNKCRGTHILVCDTPDGTFTPLSEKPATPADWECLDNTFAFCEMVNETYSNFKNIKKI